MTPLHLAVFYKRADICEMLIGAGAFVNSDGLCGKPIVLAIKNGDFPIFTLLIQ